MDWAEIISSRVVRMVDYLDADLVNIGDHICYLIFYGNG